MKFSFFRTLCLVGCASFLASVTCLAQSQLERVSITERADGLGFVVRLHLDKAPVDFTLGNPTGSPVTVDLKNTRIASDIRKDAAKGVITGYRVSGRGSGVLVAFDLGGGRPLDVRAYPDRNGKDILLALSRKGSSPVFTRPPQPVATGPHANWRLDTVVIDAGHGGKDSGAAANGLREKDIVLKVARRLGDMLKNNLGINVVYTRADDKFIELHERGRIANEAGAKLFVSIHANSAPGAGGRSATGTETYFLGTHKTDQAREVMETENAVIRFEADQTPYQAFDDGILQALAQSVYMQQSEKLASIIQQQFVSTGKRRSRGVKQAGFLVLWRASMPAVLVELGYITNPSEAAFMNTVDGQTAYARSIYQAIRAYKDHYEKGL